MPFRLIQAPLFGFQVVLGRGGKTKGQVRREDQGPVTSRHRVPSSIAQSRFGIGGWGKRRCYTTPLRFATDALSESRGAVPGGPPPWRRRLHGPCGKDFSPC